MIVEFNELVKVVLPKNSSPNPVEVLDIVNEFPTEEEDSPTDRTVDSLELNEMIEGTQDPKKQIHHDINRRLRFSSISRILCPA